MNNQVIDFPFAIDDLNKLFDVIDFLENKEELIKEFTPEVQKFMVKESFFTGPFKLAYRDAFDDLIVKLIKSQIIKHFQNLNPEEVLAICDKTFLKMLTEDYYFIQANYTTKDGKNEH